MMTFSKPKKFKTWFRKWHNLRFACWNYWSYINERHVFCKSLGYDVLVLTALHNKQNNPNFVSDLWVPSTQGMTYENGEQTDPAVGVKILLSSRVWRHIDKSDHAGTRIVWVRLWGPICIIFHRSLRSPQIPNGNVTSRWHSSRTKRPTHNGV